MVSLTTSNPASGSKIAAVTKRSMASELFRVTTACYDVSNSCELAAMTDHPTIPGARVRRGRSTKGHV